MRATMAVWRLTNRCPDALAPAVNRSHGAYDVTEWRGCAAPLRHVRFHAPHGHGIVDAVLPPELFHELKQGFLS